MALAVFIMAATTVFMTVIIIANSRDFSSILLSTILLICSLTTMIISLTIPAAITAYSLIFTTITFALSMYNTHRTLTY